MPTNLYGPGDNFHPENSHVVAALISKFHKAKELNKDEVVLWGSGKPLREFMHVDDLAEGLLFLVIPIIGVRVFLPLGSSGGLQGEQQTNKT